MMAAMKFISYNSCGLGSGRMDYLRGLLPTCTFLMLQEHWLLEQQLDKFRADLGKDVLIHGLSGMESENLLHGRPFGGVAIAWNENFKGVVSPVDFDSKRICAVKIKLQCLDSHILLINMYMPTDSGGLHVLDFQNTLMEASAIIHAHETPYIIVGGDLNTDISRVQSRQRLALLDFVQRENLLLALNHQLANVDYTYESKANGSRSLIDHFIVSESIHDLINCYEVSHHGYNISDHSSLHLGLNVPCSVRSARPTESCVHDVSWEKAKEGDVGNYQRLLDEFLSEIQIPVEAINCRNYFCNTHHDTIEVFHNSIIDACINAAKATIPKKNVSHSKGVADWNEQVRKHREKAIFWHTLWVENGRPHNGVIADIRRRTRAAYHFALKKVKNNKEKSAANKLASKMENKESKEFWKEVKKVRTGSSILPNIIDNAEGSEEICKLFSDKFKLLYNSVSYDDRDMENLLRDINDGVRDKCCRGICSEDHIISYDDIVGAMRNLKKGKSDSIPGLKSDNFIHGGNRLKVMISLLLSTMVNHGSCVGDFTKTTVIPIPKNPRKSMTTSDNYRGISLSSILGKILDHFFLYKYKNALSASDRQFGFKKGLSTSNCSTVVNEVIDYFNRQETSVYCVMLDASKAFDKVHYIKLFRLLLRKGLCPLVARFLAILYTKQKIMVKWGNNMSNEFTARNGVKQGGVLSPILFSIYLDELLHALAESGIGCYIGTHFVGAFAYADDVIILAPTLHALKKMLDVASLYSVEYMITFNATKSKLLVFGDAEAGEVHATFQGIIMRPSIYEIHLGMFLGNITMRQRIQAGVNDLYKRTNLLMAQFRFANYQVKYRLFKTHCMSLYGFQGWDLSYVGIEDIYVAWRKCIRKILGLPYRTHKALLPLIIDDVSIESQVEKRFSKYIVNLFKSDNIYLSLCKDIIVHGSRSSAGRSFNYLVSKYRWNRYELPRECSMVRDVMINVSFDNEEKKRIAGQIKELMRGRDTGLDILTTEEIEAVLFELCVN